MDQSYLEWLLGLPGFTEEKARKVAERFPTYERLEAATREELASLVVLGSADVDALLGVLHGTTPPKASDELFLCPECGSFVGTGATACPSCGVEFAGSAEADLSEELEEFLDEDGPPARLCLTCGAAMGKGATKCGMCGRQYAPSELALLPGFAGSLEEGAPFCAHCGAYLFSDEADCAICGTAVSPTVPQPAGVGGKGVVKDFLSRWQRMAEAGVPVSETDRLQEELEHFDRLLETDASLERAWSSRAKILEKLGRRDEALESLSKAADLNPRRRISIGLRSKTSSMQRRILPSCRPGGANPPRRRRRQRSTPASSKPSTTTNPCSARTRPSSLRGVRRGRSWIASGAPGRPVSVSNVPLHSSARRAALFRPQSPACARAA